MVSFAVLNGCRQNLPNQPKIDVCVILTSGNAHCIPFKHRDGHEYLVHRDELPGGFFVSADHFAEIQLYIKNLESLIEE